MDILKRDKESSALLNTNKTALEAYKLRRMSDAALVDSINSMKQDITEIKLIVQQILSEVR